MLCKDLYCHRKSLILKGIIQHVSVQGEFCHVLQQYILVSTWSALGLLHWVL